MNNTPSERLKPLRQSEEVTDIKRTQGIYKETDEDVSMFFRGHHAGHSDTQEGSNSRTEDETDHSRTGVVCHAA